MKKQDDLSFFSTVFACFDNTAVIWSMCLCFNCRDFFNPKSCQQENMDNNSFSSQRTADIQHSRFILFGKLIILLKAIQSMTAGMATIPDALCSFPFN